MDAPGVIPEESGIGHDALAIAKHLYPLPRRVATEAIPAGYISWGLFGV
ncbi:hypothetical protein N9I41_04420 [Flavobacteriaceae bacterium]|nr:hypothetical protein [Flavobacteriaceae bacterium]